MRQEGRGGGERERERETYALVDRIRAKSRGLGRVRGSVNAERGRKRSIAILPHAPLSSKLVKLTLDLPMSASIIHRLHHGFHRRVHPIPTLQRPLQHVDPTPGTSHHG